MKLFEILNIIVKFLKTILDLSKKIKKIHLTLISVFYDCFNKYGKRVNDESDSRNSNR